MAFPAEINLSNVKLDAPAGLRFGDGHLAPGTSGPEDASGGVVYVVNVECFEDARLALDRLLTLHKLWNGKPISANTYETRDPSSCDVEWTLRHYVAWDAEEVTVTVESAREFNEFWHQHANINVANFAVARFREADHRPYDKDQFLDYLAALEFLFCPTRGALDATFRKVGCMILGAKLDAGRRMALHKALKDSYDVRSRVVHGSKLEFPDTSAAWSPRIDQARAWSREAINFFHVLGLLDDGDRRHAYIEQWTLFGAGVDLAQVPTAPSKS